MGEWQQKLAVRMVFQDPGVCQAVNICCKTTDKGDTLVHLTEYSTPSLLHSVCLQTLEQPNGKAEEVLR